MKIHKNCPYDLETFVSNMRSVEDCIFKQNVLIQCKERELEDLRKDLSLLYAEHEDLCSWIEEDD
jgi:hypothetical protein